MDGDAAKLEYVGVWEWVIPSRYQTEKKDVLQRRIRKGIPDALRGRVWCLLLSADVCSDIYNSRITGTITNARVL